MMNQFNPYARIPAQQSSLDWIMVQSVDQVESVVVQPNTKAWIMVQNEPIFALRTSDTMGLAKTEYYKFEKYEPNPAPDYVTMEQLKELLKEMKEDDNESTTEGNNGFVSGQKPKRCFCGKMQSVRT